MNAPPQQLPESDLFVVAIGASAGGFEAVSKVIERLHVDGIAIVVVQHGLANGEEFLADLLRRASRASIVPLDEGTSLSSGCIYIVPPQTDVAMLHGVAHHMTPSSQLPIDYFMRSLADDIGWRALGIVLSGTGSDGTFGLKAIKQAGGITFVQEPESAAYEAMPRHALESGYADFCLSPEALATELLYVLKHPSRSRTGTSLPRAGAAMSKLMVLIRAAFDNDLTQYKPGTLERRIERRMALHKIERLDDYVRFLQAKSGELELLYKDILIGVTAFFRDREPFDALRREVLPRLIEQKPAGGTIRIWVPACSTGEEVYSIAITLLEVLDTRAVEYRIQIFGTDLDEVAVQRARKGVYPENIVLDVSPERLARFFVKKEGEYQVASRLREMVIFSVQNLIQDAPLSKLDLVSCRNVLIYLQPAVQKKVLHILHYALVSHGVLLLGTSESVGELSDLFSLADRRNKIYTKRDVASLRIPDVGFGPKVSDGVHRAVHEATHRPELNVAALVERRILDLYAPSGVVVNRDLEIIHIRGRTGPYLEPMPGSPSFNLLKLTRAELHIDSRRAVHEAQQRNARVTVDSHISDGTVARHVRIEVVPLLDGEPQQGSLVVLFHELAEPIRIEKPTGTLEPSEHDALQRELALTKEYLQTAIEELESSNEELKSSNEELQSSNEELQSTNEELTTSKEELQSTNEELTTVNDELQGRMSELQQTNEDLQNVLSGIGRPIVLIGNDLRIRRFTPSAESLLNLLPGDVGRMVSQLNSFVVGIRIEAIAAQVIQRLVPTRLEVQGTDLRWYELSVTPYRTQDRVVRGALVSFVDIDVQKLRGDIEGDPTRWAANFFRTVKEALILLDENGEPVWRNDAYVALFGDRPWRAPTLQSKVEALLERGVAFDFVSTQYAFDDHPRTLSVSGGRLPSVGNRTLVVLTFGEAPFTENP